MDMTIHDVRKIELKEMETSELASTGKYFTRRIIIHSRENEELELLLFAKEKGALGI